MSQPPLSLCSWCLCRLFPWKTYGYNYINVLIGISCVVVTSWSSSSTSALALQLPLTEIKYVNGRRCMISLSTNEDDDDEQEKPSRSPLILIGGTAQTISSWEYHVTYLSKDRDVLVYECLGQGPYPPHLTTGERKNYFKDVSLERQAKDVSGVIHAVFPCASCVDIAGFSFGGRVAMATVVGNMVKVRKLHITGVPASRSPYARLVLSCWKELLTPQDESSDNSSLRAFVWSSILSTFSSAFLGKNNSRVPRWVDTTCLENTRSGILALLQQTHTEDENNDWHPVFMARHIANQNSDSTSVCLVVGSEDGMASIEETERLGQIIGGRDVNVFVGCGHAAPMEEARRWRGNLLAFLNDDI